MPEPEQENSLRIERPNTYRLIADRIVAEVADGRLGSGDVVPAERELAEQYGVGRSSVREGLRLLEAHRVVLPGRATGSYRIGRRDGAMVAALEMLTALGEATLDDIHALRRTVEIEATGLAARNRSPEDINAIRIALQSMIASRNIPRMALEADLDFHVALARASKNGAFSATVMGVRTALSATIDTRNFNIDEAIAQHQLIVEAIVARDEEAARQRADEHMEWIAGTRLE